MFKMNSPTALFLAAALGLAYSQEQCSSTCAPQPVTIQLSCNGNRNQGVPPPPPPPQFFPPAPAPEPTPAHAPAPSQAPASSRNVMDDPDRHSKCLWKNNGYGLFFLDGNFKNKNKYWLNDWEGLYSITNRSDPYHRIVWLLDDLKKPPRGWDGSEDSLGFPLPQKGTPEYDYYLCWPLLQERKPSAALNIKDDPDRHDDRKSCNWLWSKADRCELNYGNLKGGFPSVYKMCRQHDPMNVNIVTAEGVPRPAQDWDGRVETLGFPMPEKNTPLYNMLMCWPYDIRL